MDQVSRKLHRKLYRLKNRPTPLTSEERLNLINSRGLYRILSNRNKAVDILVTELLSRK